jgi:N-acetyl-gamma-glutamyl-phosphate reductase
LVNHPHTEIAFVHSKSNAGNLLSSVHADLLGETEMQFSDSLNDDIDVLFLCVGQKKKKKFLLENKIADRIKIIDLSQDFRLTEHAKTPSRDFVYGLPELNKEKIRSASNIANPGCFATGIQLGLLPLAKEGLLGHVYTQVLPDPPGRPEFESYLSFSWRSSNIQAYKTLNHQHLDEINESLHQLQNSFRNNPLADGIHFVPWRGDFTRGIFISSQINCDLKIEKLIELFDDFYADHPFTFLSQDAIFLKQVVNTNKCVIQLEKVGSKLVIHSAIDNLLKGASGQAVQNMNLMFGLEECTGLRLKANYF